jgi:hypothetical protein
MNWMAEVKKMADTPSSKLPKKLLSPAAQRALAEAEARRQAAAMAPQQPTELDGRGGPDPVRYGDWEVKGIASDF